jgi:hypothetical protein
VLQVAQAGVEVPLIDVPLKLCRAAANALGIGGLVFYWFTVCPAPEGGAVDYSRCASSPTLSTHDGSPVGTWKVPVGTLNWGDDAQWYVQVSDVNTGSTFSDDQLTSRAEATGGGADVPDVGAAVAATSGMP